MGQDSVQDILLGENRKLQKSLQEWIGARGQPLSGEETCAS